MFIHSGLRHLLGPELFWALWLTGEGWTARQDGRAWAVPLTWSVALGGRLISCRFGPFCCQVEMRVLALSVVLWWDFAKVLTNLLKGPAKLQRQSCLSSTQQCPGVPRHPGNRADRTGSRNLGSRVPECLSNSPDVCRGPNRLSQQDQCAKRNCLEGFHHCTGT